MFKQGFQFTNLNEIIGGIDNLIKQLTIFLVIVSIAIMFGGTASAALSVNVTVDHNGQPVKVAHPGNHDVLNVVAKTNNESIQNPQTLIKTTPGKGLKYDTSKALMIVNGGKAISNTDPKHGGFFVWSDQDESWFWAISQITGAVGPNTTLKLIVPVTVNSTGKISTDAIFEGSIMDNGPMPAESAYTFTSTANNGGNNNANTNTDDNTIPMKDTGAPLALGALGLVSLIGGTLYSRRR